MVILIGKELQVVILIGKELQVVILIGKELQVVILIGKKPGLASSICLVLMVIESGRSFKW